MRDVVRTIISQTIQKCGKMWNARRATIISHFHLLLSTNSHKGMSKTASNEMIMMMMMMMTFTARSTKDDLDSVNGNIIIRYYH